MSVVLVSSVLKNASPSVIFEYLEFALNTEDYKHLKTGILEIFKTEGGKLTKKVISPIFTELQKHSNVISFFEKIHHLANTKHFDETESILLNLCAKKDILQNISKENAYDKMIELFLKDKDLFIHLYHILASKEHGESSWIERKDFEIPQNFSEEMIGERIAILKEEIKKVSLEEGRKGICKEGYFEYNKEFWIVFDVEDSIQTNEVLDETGEFNPTNFTPKKSIIFVLNPETHSLKMHAKGGDKQNKEFTEKFCKIILDTEISQHPPKNHYYNIQEMYLTTLKQGSLKLRMTESEIRKIFINKVRLKKEGGKFIRTPEISIKKGVEDCICEEFEALGFTSKIEPTKRLEGENWNVEQIHLTALYYDDLSKTEQWKHFSITSAGKVNLNYAGIGNKIRNVFKENGLC